MKTNPAIIAVALTVIGASSANAGPLAPPPGAVVSSYKTLLEVEPRIAINAINTPGNAGCMFRITSPGSYYLTEQLAILPDKHGIEIVANNVTIDLNGYRIGAFPGGFSGIQTVGNLENLTIHNGMIGPCMMGIDLDESFSVVSAVHLYDLTISDCFYYGIDAGGGALIERVVVSGCGAGGIDVDAESLVSACVAQRCWIGIDADSGSRVEGCLASQNDFHGIVVGEACTVRNNTSHGNGVTSPWGTGIYSENCQDTLIVDNHCSGNDRGIWTTKGGAIVIRNVCANNEIQWTLAAGTNYGPIIDRTNPGTAAVNGNSAPDGLGSSHPNANFTQQSQRRNS